MPEMNGKGLELSQTYLPPQQRQQSIHETSAFMV
jgi:hypothetical protein